MTHTQQLYMSITHANDDDRIELTDWECDFLDSIELEIRPDTLTTKQKATLVSIAEKYGVR